jgi:hypothetical protein
MYDMPDRRSRRAIAKQLGLLKSKSKLPFKKWAEEVQRSQQLGNEIHRKKVEEMLRTSEEKEAATSSFNEVQPIVEEDLNKEA